MQVRSSGSKTVSHGARHVAAMAVIILSWTLGSAGAEAVEVSRQTTVSHSPDEVWAMIGEFGTIDRWHPAIETSVVEGDGGHGIYRTLTLGDGGVIRELLLDYSLRDRHYSYAILESPLPVANYVSTLAVTPGPDDGSAIVTWTSTFDANGVSDQEAADLIGGIYQAGFDSITTMLGHSKSRPASPAPSGAGEATRGPLEPRCAGVSGTHGTGSDLARLAWLSDT